MRLEKWAGLGVAIALSLSGIQAVIAQTPAQTPARTPAAPVPVKPDVPYVPTPESVVMEMLQLGNVTKDDVVYDLGSGDGRLVINAVQKFGAKKGIGIEINPGLVNRSTANAKAAGVSDRATFFQQDLFETDLREASVVTLYLLPKINLRLRPKLFKELKPGSRVVSHSFGMGDWKPDRTILVKDNGRPRSLYLWMMPANVNGTWSGTLSTKSGRQPYRVQVQQEFQNIRATVQTAGTSISLPQIRLVGDRIMLQHSQKLNGQDISIKFDGRVAGDTLQGTAELKTATSTETIPLVAKRQTN